MLRKFVKFILDITANYTGRIAVLVFLLLYVGLFWSFAPYILKVIIDTLVNYRGDPAHVFSEVMLHVSLYLFAWFTAMISFRALDLIERSLYPHIRRDILNKMFGHIVYQSHQYFQNNFSGSISNRMIDMQNGVVSILRKMDEVFFNIVFLICAFALLIMTNKYIALIFFAWLIVFSFVSFLFFKSVVVLSEDFSLSKTALVGYFVDTLANMSVVRFFSRQNFESIQADSMIHKTVIKERAMRKQIIIMRTLWDFTMLITMVALFAAMLHLYSKKLITVGDFAFVTSLSMSVFHSLWHLTTQYAEFSEELGKCYQAMEIMETPHSIVDKENSIELKNAKGEIEFRNVTFNYGGDKKLFKNKSIHIKPKEKVGLVGFSGSGKSSFISLIARLFDVESGQILIDGKDIKDLTQESLRQNIAIIPQDPGLFHRTVKENIAYGNPKATEKQIILASKFAHCHEFIEKMEDGYDTRIGERGVKLSGGQRQRIAIARAFLEGAPILILDEATSALDSVTETLIQESLNKLMHNKTTIVIAHRLSTLSQMDRILVFDQGKLIEEGKHDELINANGHYAMMWSIQAKGAMLPE